LRLKRNTSAKRISESLSIEKNVLKKLNPALRSVVWKHKALIPKGYEIRVSYREQGWDQEVAKMNHLPQEIERAGYKWHRVKSGQTACGIAEKNRVSCRALFKLNKLDKKGTIYVGRRIKVPTKTGGISIAKNKTDIEKAAHLDAITKTQPASSSSTSRYRVKRGDTACSIAYKFNMSCSEFLAINGLTQKSIIRSDAYVMVAKNHQWHRVEKGESACQIAEKYNIGCSKLLAANRLTKRSVIRIGQTLRIPL